MAVRIIVCGKAEGCTQIDYWHSGKIGPLRTQEMLEAVVTFQLLFFLLSLKKKRAPVLCMMFPGDGSVGCSQKRWFPILRQVFV